jgi:hypothetical protein
MTCGRVRFPIRSVTLDGAAASHPAELVRGYFITTRCKGPLIRPSGTFSPRGEGPPVAARLMHLRPHRLATG